MDDIATTFKYYSRAESIFVSYKKKQMKWIYVRTGTREHAYNTTFLLYNTHSVRAAKH